MTIAVSIKVSATPFPCLNACRWCSVAAIPAFVYATSMIFIAAVAIKMAKTIFSTSKTFQMAVAH